MFSSAASYITSSMRQSPGPEENKVELASRLKLKPVDDCRHSFDLLLPDEDKNTTLNFNVFGCAGDDEHNNQSLVAAHMQAVAAANGKPHFMILLGDNFYDNGVLSTRDPLFQTNFYGPYQNPRLPDINGIHYFVIAGNHDWNLHDGWTNRGPARVPLEGAGDLSRLVAQIDHTYCDEDGNENPEFRKPYQEKKLDVSKLQTWNMPARFYVLRWRKLELFFLDSNTYVRDFLQKENARSRGEPLDPNNQAVWLEKNATNADTTKILFLHHPLLTLGKRAAKPDTDTYLNKAEVNELSSKHGIEGGYNEILRRILLEKQGLNFDTVCAAHDHVMTYYKRDGLGKDALCQATIGSGGGPLQYRECIKTKEEHVDPVAFFAREFGFVNAQYDPKAPRKEVVLNFHHNVRPEDPALGGHLQRKHARFSSLSAEPIQLLPEEEESKIQKLRELYLVAYKKYLDKNYIHKVNEEKLTASPDIKPHTPAPAPSYFSTASFFSTLASAAMEAAKAVRKATGFDHGTAGLERADKLRNFFNNYQIESLAACIDALRECLCPPRAMPPTRNSLIKIFSRELKKHGLGSFESFMANPDKIANVNLEAVESEDSEEKMTYSELLVGTDLPGSGSGSDGSPSNAGEEQANDSPSQDPTALTAYTQEPISPPAMSLSGIPSLFRQGPSPLRYALLQSTDEEFLEDQNGEEEYSEYNLPSSRTPSHSPSSGKR